MDNFSAAKTVECKKDLKAMIGYISKSTNDLFFSWSHHIDAWL